MTDVQKARIEAAARAMWERTPREGDPTWADLDYGIKEIWRKDAASALRAADAVVTVEDIADAIDREIDLALSTRLVLAHAIQRLYRGEAGAVQCDQHKPVQHRDGKPPWCRACGKTAANTVPNSRFSGEAGA